MTAKIIPMSSRQSFGRTRPPAGQSADVLAHPSANSQEIMRTIGKPQSTFYITFNDPKTGRSVKVDGPFYSPQEAQAALREVWQAAPGSKNNLQIVAE